jgi:hypothetical protein
MPQNAVFQSQLSKKEFAISAGVAAVNAELFFLIDKPAGQPFADRYVVELQA